MRERAGRERECLGEGAPSEGACSLPACSAPGGFASEGLGLGGVGVALRGLSQYTCLLGAAFLLSCGPPPKAPEPETPAVARRSKAAVDDCAEQPGKPPPKPLEREYQGVAKAARCDREVYTIMGGVVHSLGVPCEHCHVPGDYRAMTHKKHVANWMATELIPALRTKTGRDVECRDCHRVGEEGTPKPLGKDRERGEVLEWMNLQLVARFETKDGGALHCKACHGGTLGSPEFRSKVILADIMGDNSFSIQVASGAPDSGVETPGDGEADGELEGDSLDAGVLPVER
ncbi:MAG: hypothetical protein KIT72_03190 [Polyangiaceae bacterium]|nr:hypothetical protein [Polyangiaceae bacterium]MCW5789405.1 hypothetical protein [Polyangiaceae bacterium]